MKISTLLILLFVIISCKTNNDKITDEVINDKPEINNIKEAFLLTNLPVGRREILSKKLNDNTNNEYLKSLDIFKY